MIDLSDAGVAPRVRFPRAADRFSSGSSRSTTTPGSSIDLTRQLRSRVSAQDLARMRSAAGQAQPTVRSRPVSSADILSRYRGSSAATRSRSAAASTPARGERSATDPRLARRRAADNEGLSQARIDARRAKDARAAKQASDAQRARDAREAKLASNAQRAADVRAAMRTERIQRARENYIDSIQSSGSGESHYGDGDGDYDDGYDDGYHDGYHDGYWDYGWFAGWGFYGSCWGGYWGWNWYGPFWGWSFWWHHYWYNGGYWFPGYSPSYYWYGPFSPRVIIQVGDTSDQDVVYVYDDDPEVVVIDGSRASVGEGAPAPAPAAATPTPAPPTDTGTADDASQSLGRAVGYYLTLGDRAFRDGRYGEAVHDYAKAVEYQPEEGILYLILSDALMASGDYHYAAFSLRKALELDPALVTNVVDKHSLYPDPAEFDRQLAVLELYLEDHFLDDDARLVLAANYLFGGRPAAAVDLLEGAFSVDVKNTPAGGLILEAARAIQYGTPAHESSEPGGAPAQSDPSSATDQ